MNFKTVEVFGFPKELISQIPKLKPNLLEFAIAPKETMPVSVWKGDDEKSLKVFEIAQIAQFKVEQLGRENDTWYKKLIEKLAKNDRFRKLWFEVKPEVYHKKLLDYEYKIVELPDNFPKAIKFHIFTSRIITDQRFQLVLYSPAS